MKDRPNSNQILCLVRDGDLAYDPWGTAMAWAFACAENLAVEGADVPASLGYRPGAGGPVLESYEDREIQEYITAAAERDLFTYESAIEDVQFAARCLSRYIDWCKAAGKDY